MPASPSKVFVSGTTGDLGSCRKMVTDILIGKEVLPIVQDHFPPDSRTVAEMLRDKIGGCDAVICLVGTRFGAEPRERTAGEPRRSYTQREYDIAVELGKPVFLFLGTPDVDVESTPEEEEPVELRALQHEFRTQLRSAGRVWTEFQSRDDLVAKVALLQFNSESIAACLNSQLSVLLFTDLLDSTGLKSRLGDGEYARAIAMPHNQLFRDVLSRFADAQEENYTGDGFLATFERVQDAVYAAILFHDALDQYPWSNVKPQTRIGIHLGQITRIPAPDGTRPHIASHAADLCARLMSLAGGKQTLLTRAAFDNARQYVRDVPVWNPAGSTPLTISPDKVESVSAGDVGARHLELSWLAHGRYLFKGRDEAMEVFEVGVVGRAPLIAPADSEKVRRADSAEEEQLRGWRPALELAIPERPGWRIERKLGEGGFGEVWIARHHKTKELRVFKFCHDAARLQSFKRELTLFRLLKEALGDRDDIARLHEVRLEAPPYFLESDFVPGGNLREWVECRGGLNQLSLDERIRIVNSIAQAVAAAHSVGIIHRDLKPSNVLMSAATADAQVVLADFGIGALADRSLLQEHGITAAGFTDKSLLDPGSSRTGTRMYQAPEAHLGRLATMQGDVYALGVLLYQMLIGNFEQPLGPGWERTFDLQETDLDRCELLRSDIRDSVETDPLQRLANAAAFAQRLELLPQRATARRAERRQARAAERYRSLRRWVMVASALVFAFGSLSAWSFLQWQRANDETVRATNLAKFARTKELEAKALKAAAEANADQARNQEALAVSAREHAEQRQFVAEMQIAEQNWGINLVDSVRLTLNKWSSTAGNIDRISYPWHYLSNLVSDAQRYTLPGARGPIQALACTDDGRWLVAVSRTPAKRAANNSGDLTEATSFPALEVFDIANLSLAARVELPYEPASAALTPNGSGYLALGRDGKLREYSLPRLEETRVNTIGNLQDAVATAGLAFSTDGERLLIAAVEVSNPFVLKTTVFNWPNLSVEWEEITASQQPLGNKFDLSVDWFKDSPRGLIAIGSGGGWMLNVAEKTATSFHLGLAGSRNADASPTDNMVAFGTTEGAVEIRDGEDLAVSVVLDDRKQLITAVKYSRDGALLAVAGEDGRIQIWSRYGQRLTALRGNTFSSRSIAWITESLLATGDGNGQIRIWNVNQPPEYRHWGNFPRPLVNVAPVSGTRTAAIALFDESGANQDGQVLLQDLDRGTSIPLSQVGGDAIAAATWSANGQFVFGGSSGQQGFGSAEFRLWDAATGDMQRPLGRFPGMAAAVACAPNGRWLAGVSAIPGTDGKSRILVWDSATGDLVQRLPKLSTTVSSIAISSNSRWLAIGTGSFSNLKVPGQVAVWDLENRRWKIPPKDLDQSVLWLRFSPNGESLLVAMGRFYDFASTDGRTQVIELGDAEETLRLETKGSGAVFAACWSPDVETIAASSFDGGVRLWDPKSGELVRTIKTGNAPANWVEFSPDGKHLLVASTEGLLTGSPGSQLTEFDISTGGRIKARAFDTTISQFSFDPSGQRLLIATTGDAHILRAGDWELRQTLAYPTGAPDSHRGPVVALAASPDGKWIATGGADTFVKIWELENLQQPTTLEDGHTSAVADVAFSQDGVWLASVSGAIAQRDRQLVADQELILWNMQTKTKENSIALGPANMCRVAFVPKLDAVAVAVSQPIAASMSPPEVRIYGMPSGDLLAIHRGLPADSIQTLSVSNDGRWLAFGLFEKAVFLGETSPVGSVVQIGSMPSQVTGMAFTPDSKVLAVSSDDGRYRLYDVITRSEFFTIEGHPESISCLAFTADGKSLLTGAAEDFTGAIRVWPSAPSSNQFNKP